MTDRCGPEGRHDAPDPVDEPTRCPCGIYTRIPAKTATQTPPPAEDADHG